jgi:RNA polymerase sigma factor (sigma-70 family)
VAAGQFASILQFIRKLTGSAPAGTASDGQLLERFARDKDEDAFAALLARHGPMVLGICQRVLRDTHEAEDAFQATFLVLARKAGGVRQQQALASWLCQVAYHVALAIRQRSARQQELARQAGAAKGETMAETASWELRQILDEELNRLPKKYHAPVVLCYLQGKTCAEAAEHLDWPAGTVKVRLMRARELLRARLERRGLALSAAAFSASLAPEALAATVPPALVEATLKSALAFAAGKAGLASGAAVVVAEQLLHAMGAKLRKMLAAVALLVALLGTGVCWQVFAKSAPQAPPTVVALAPIPAGEEPEVRYQGKPVGHWREVLQQSPVDNCRVEAAQALAALSQIAATEPTAVPALLKARDDQSPAVRQAVVKALGSLAGNHEQAVTSLVAALKDKETRSDAVRALMRLGPQAASAEPTLQAALQDDDPQVRLSAALVLSQLVQGPQAFDPAPVIRNASDYDRAWVLSAVSDYLPEQNKAELLIEFGHLHQLKSRGASGVSSLTKVLADPRRGSNLRMYAASLLGDMSPEARAALPTLTQALQDKDAGVRYAAAVAHWQLAAQADKVVPILVEALQGNNPDRSWHAAGLLGQLGPKSADATMALTEALKHENKSVRLAAALAHWRLVHEVAPVAPLLAELLQDQSFQAPTAMRLPPSTAADLPLLMELLRRQKNNQGYRRWNLRGALQHIGVDAVPELLKALMHDNPLVRKSAADVLNFLDWFGDGEGAEPKQVRPETLKGIAEGLTHANSVVRQWALFVWAQQADRDRALPAVLQGLQDADAKVRQVAVAAIGSFGPKAKAAVPILGKILENDPPAGLQAASALWDIDPQAGALQQGLSRLMRDQPGATALVLADKGTKALPILRPALGDANPAVRLGAISGLIRMHTAAADVAWDLNHALDDADLQVRRTAAEGLLRLSVQDPESILRLPGDGPPSSGRLPADRIQKALTILKNLKGELPAGMLATVPRFGKVSAQPVLRAALKEPPLRVEAAALLGDNLDADTQEEVITALAAALRDKDLLRHNAAQTLGRLGPAAKPAVPALQASLNDAEPLVRIAAAGALWKIDPQQEAVLVPVLCDALRLKLEAPKASRVPLPPSAGHTARTAAAQVLQEIAPAGKQAIPLLIEALREEAVVVPGRTPRPADPYHAALREALRRYGKEAVPSLIKAMTHDLRELRESAFAILGDLGAEAKEAVPALLDACLDKDPQFRAAAMVALKKIDAEAAAGVR